MSGENWTKGPWSVGKEGRWLVCTLSSSVKVFADQQVGITAKHDARLIAASPTLADYAIKKAEEGCGEALAMLISLNIINEDRVRCLKQRYKTKV